MVPVCCELVPAAVFSSALTGVRRRPDGLYVADLADGGKLPSQRILSGGCLRATSADDDRHLVCAGPAAGAGMLVGDAIIRVDGKHVGGSLEVAKRHVLGRPGTSVTVEFAREGASFTVSLTRDKNFINAVAHAPQEGEGPPAAGSPSVGGQGCAAAAPSPSNPASVPRVLNTLPYKVPQRSDLSSGRPPRQADRAKGEKEEERPGEADAELAKEKLRAQVELFADSRMDGLQGLRGLRLEPSRAGGARKSGDTADAADNTLADSLRRLVARSVTRSMASMDWRAGAEEGAEDEHATSRQGQVKPSPVAEAGSSGATREEEEEEEEEEGGGARQHPQDAQIAGAPVPATGSSSSSSGRSSAPARSTSNTSSSHPADAAPAAAARGALLLEATEGASAAATGPATRGTPRIATKSFPEQFVRAGALSFKELCLGEETGEAEDAAGGSSGAAGVRSSKGLYVGDSRMQTLLREKLLVADRSVLDAADLGIVVRAVAT